MGTTGQSSGTHLHYGLRDPKGVSFDPAPYIGMEKILGSDSPVIPAQQPIASSSQKSSATFKVGDIVQFTGGNVYISSTATVPVNSKGKSRCKVTQVSNGKQLYHLIREDNGGVYGWVLADDVTAIGDTPDTQSTLELKSLDEIAREVIRGSFISVSSLFEQSN